MSNQSAARIPFPAGKPIPWRIVDPGLCLEGRCLDRNRSCRAYKQMVIGSYKMGQFTVTSSLTFPCPECGSDVRTLKFGLNRCQWRIIDTHKWHNVNDAYQPYDLSASPILIETRPVEKDEHLSKEDCTICLSAMEEKRKCSILPCQHVFHMECIHGWIDADEETSLQCPICRRPIFE